MAEAWSAAGDGITMRWAEEGEGSAVVFVHGIPTPLPGLPSRVRRVRAPWPRPSGHRPEARAPPLAALRRPRRSCGLSSAKIRSLRTADTLAVADGLAAPVAAGVPSGDRRPFGAFEQLPAHPDAEPALSRLSAAGVRIVALTNGGPAQIAALLAAAGLDRHVEQLLAVEEAGRWKPAAPAYHYAASALGVDPARLPGAVARLGCAWRRRARLVTGWASRWEARFPDVFDPLHVSGRDLMEVADGLLMLPDQVTGSTGGGHPGA